MPIRADVEIQKAAKHKPTGHNRSRCTTCHKPWTNSVHDVPAPPPDPKRGGKAGGW